MELTAAERRLVDHVVDGTVCDLAPESPDDAIDETVMRSWGAEHDIRAGVIRDILRGRHLPSEGPDPHGLQVRGARIVGRIDLDGLTAPIPLTLSCCYLPGGLSGDHCVIPGLIVTRSAISIPEDQGAEPAVNLVGARIAGDVILRGASLHSTTGPALDADRAMIGGGVFLHRGVTATGYGERGAVRLLGIRVAGQLVLRNATLCNEAGPALAADGAMVGGDAFLDGGFTATGIGSDCAVRLLGAHIAGELSLQGATVGNTAGAAVGADGATIDGDAVFNGLRATGVGADGAVRLLGVHIAGQLSLQGATLGNTAGPALNADRATIGGGTYLDGGSWPRGTAQRGRCASRVLTSAVSWCSAARPWPAKPAPHSPPMG